MVTEKIEHELRDALIHLYDPDHQPSEALYELMGCDAQGGALAVQSAIIQAIESLEPPPDTPSNARLRQVYELLRNRFVLKLTLDETAERMHMSFSSTWRAQRAAIHALAQTLWSHRAYREPPEGRTDQRAEPPHERQTADTQATDWHSQVQRELASLQARSPDQVADVGETIAGVLDLMGALTSEQNVAMKVKYVQPDLVAAVHPAVLRQVLIMALRRLVRVAPTEEIDLYAGLEDGNVKITAAGTVTSGQPLSASELTDDLLVPDGIPVEAYVDGSQVFLWIGAPSVGRTTVLVVDDNPDMARFYRRATEGTSYRIVHLAQGQDLLEVVSTLAPDIIVLDVMLPDIDGWQLLMQLHEDPATRAIPVIVCTVVREEELALSLGAALFLPKPVRPREFIQALDQVLLRVSAATPTSQANNAATC